MNMRRLIGSGLLVPASYPDRHFPRACQVKPDTRGFSHLALMGANEGPRNNGGAGKRENGGESNITTPRPVVGGDLRARALLSELKAVADRRDQLADQVTVFTEHVRGVAEKYGHTDHVMALFSEWAPTYPRHITHSTQEGGLSCQTAVENVMDQIYATLSIAGIFPPVFKEPIAILDPSVGAGLSLLYLIRKIKTPNIARIVANDLSPDMSKEGQRLLRQELSAEDFAKIEFTYYNMENRKHGKEGAPKFGYSEFDLELLTQTLPFISADGFDTTFDNLSKALRVGGRLIVIEDVPPVLTTDYTDAQILVPDLVRFLFFKVMETSCMASLIPDLFRLEVLLTSKGLERGAQANPVPFGDGRSSMHGIVFRSTKSGTSRSVRLTPQPRDTKLRDSDKDPTTGK